MKKTNVQLENQELISVIVPVYGVEQYLEKCLNSIINQTYEHLEIIVIDDGTKDKSGEIADKFAEVDSRIVVYHKENGGLSDARNYGIKRAHGEYITCIDSDDYVDEDYVYYLFDKLKKYSADIAFCQHRVIFPSGKIRDNGKSDSELISAKRCIERILYDDVLDTSAWAKLYKRSLFDDVEYPKGMLFEDIGTTYKLIMQCKEIAIGYETKYNYVLRKDSIVTGSFNPKKLDLLIMTDQMANKVAEVYPDLSNAALRRRVYARFSTLNQMLDVDTFEKEKHDIINFIEKNRIKILKDGNAPLRDKIAIFLLWMDYYLYKIAWKSYQKRLYK